MAASAYYQQVQQMYVAYFGRPADKTGLEYYANLLDKNGGNDKAMLHDFANSAESKALYNQSTLTAKIASMYWTLFGKEGDLAGVTYWAAQVQSGAVILSEAAAAIAFNAQPAEKAAFNAKLAAAAAFTAKITTTQIQVSYETNTAKGAQWLYAVTNDATAQAAVASVDSTIASIVTGNQSQTATLTNGVDVLQANLFNAGQVYTPGGNDFINSLQNDDVLTGIGANSTLNVTLGNPNDNGQAEILPTLKAIETINAKFDATSVSMQLDLQDSTGVKNVNISRIADGRNATVKNIAEAGTNNLSVANTQSPAGTVNFTYIANALSATDNTAALKVSNVNVANLVVQAADGTTGFENINLTSTGSANVIGQLTAQDVQTLNITGDKNLQLGGRVNTTGAQGVEATGYTAGLNNVAGSLNKVDASTMTANLDYTIGTEITAARDNTSGLAVDMSVVGGKGNDTFRLLDGSGVQLADSINGGEGTNTLTIHGTATVAGTVSKVQNLEIRTGHDTGTGADTVTVDTTRITDLTKITIRNEGQTAAASAAEGMTVNLNGLNAAQAAGLNVLHGTTGNNGLANNVVNAVVGAGVTTVGVTIADGVNANPQFNLSLRADSNATALDTVNTVANVTITDNDTESNSVQLVEFARHTGTVTLAGGATGSFMNLDSTGNALRYAQDGSNGNGTAAAIGAGVRADVGAGAAERLQAATVDSTAHLGDVTVRMGLASTATTTGAQTVKLGAGNDTVIFDVLNDTRAGFTISDTVSGGAGNDTLVIDGNGVRVTLGSSEFTNTTGMENLRFIGNNAATAGNTAYGNNSYNVTLSDNFVTNNAAGGKVINIINDNDSRNDAGVHTAAIVTAEAAAVAAGLASIASQSVGVTIDARALSASFGINFNGEEGTAATSLGIANPMGTIAARTTAADRFIFADRNIDGTSTIDGGAMDNVAQVGATYNTGVDGIRNADVLEVRNTADVSIGDLANIRNVGTLVFNVDAAVEQTLTLQLNDAVIDALVDSYHTASLTQLEQNLNVVADDGTVTGGGASRVVIDASQVTGVTGFNFTDDATGATQAIDTVTVAARVAGNADTIRFSTAGDSFVVTGTATQAVANFSGANTTVGALTLATNTVSYITGAASLSDSVTFGAGVNVSFANFAGTTTILGSAVADTLVGSAQADVITGGAGADTITLGAGTDTLVLNQTATADTITDYVVADDTIQLSKGVYTALAGAVGAVTLGADFAAVANAAALTGGSVAASTNAQAIVYVQDTGALYYNADGATAGGLTLIGTFSNGAVLAATEFTIIA